MELVEVLVPVCGFLVLGKFSLGFRGSIRFWVVGLGDWRWLGLMVVTWEKGCRVRGLRPPGEGCWDHGMS